MATTEWKREWRKLEYDPDKFDESDPDENGYITITSSSGIYSTIRWHA